MPPPPKNPPRPFGEYCWRATCHVVDDDVQRMASFVGYDATLSVTDAVHTSCERHCKIYGGKCTPPELVLLPSSRRECSGQIFYFTLDGATRRVV